MLPVIPEEKWRKNGQWIGLIREHAELIAQDFLVASKFEEHCKLEGGALPCLIPIGIVKCHDTHRQIRLFCARPYALIWSSISGIEQLPGHRLRSQRGRFGLYLQVRKQDSLDHLLAAMPIGRQALYPVPMSQQVHKKERFAQQEMCTLSFGPLPNLGKEAHKSDLQA